jgi:hypothetical protein
VVDAILYVMYFRNAIASSPLSDVYRCIILTNLPESVFNILLYSYAGGKFTELYFHNVAFTKNGIPWLVKQMEFNMILHIPFLVIIISYIINQCTLKYCGKLVK